MKIFLLGGAQLPPPAMAGPLLPSTGHCPPCTHGCSQPGQGLSPISHIPPSHAAAKSCWCRDGGTPPAPFPSSEENSHLSPQKPPVKPLRVPSEKAAASHAAEDAAEPGKLISFVIRVGAELATQRCWLALPTTGLQSLGLFPPAGKASKGGDTVPTLPKFIPHVLITVASHQPLHRLARLRKTDDQGSRCRGLPLP